MNSLWNDADAARFEGALGQRVYSSRLLGRDTSLVLHGGGNTSVKIVERTLLENEEEILYVKGSGWDLETITEAGFSPVRLAHLRSLATLESLSDPDMVNQMLTHMTRHAAPTPSIEAILHAILPYTFVDHTHADAVVTITNTDGGEARIREVYGRDVVVIPYVMPGFDLARRCAELFPVEANPGTLGMILLNHGVFSFGASARESYERMIDLVNRAEQYLARQRAWRISAAPAAAVPHPVRTALATLRRAVSEAAGFPTILVAPGGQDGLAFARRSDVAVISQQGPATPDHVIRTKRLPMLGRDVPAYARAYRDYFGRQAPATPGAPTMLDPAPRVILDPELGLVSVGRTARDAGIVGDIYTHTIEVILRATALGGFRALPERELFAVEYWDLEQAKLKKGGVAPMFAGEVALVTGAASGIGQACVASLLARGAAVVGLDINPTVAAMHARADFLGLPCDVTDEAAVGHALESAARAFGGLDMLVLNAGSFPPSQGVEALTTEAWRSAMAINVDANLVFLRECYPVLKLAPRQGRVVVIGSKNVAAPGLGAAAYSASKAALTQLARVAALEWGGDGIRVNLIHPDAVFDTGLWTDEVLAGRAARYGLTVEQYKRKNLLQTVITSRDVGELAAEMCGPLFGKTTGAQVPIDGGNERVI
jgi:rhamnose utilization protein RhaD (predicted bifunctional aldolase and dehydrogenase)/NAD(P)-dependent dehydrogenase (short-subunit alcohol dehydrogenase family)